MQKIGIDAGGSLIKISFEENGRLRHKKYPIKEMDSAFTWLKMVASSASVVLTGGKAGWVQERFFPEATIIPEFRATCEGAVHMLKEKNLIPEEPFLLVNIGTGTSWHIVKEGKSERILGSGVGGGTLVGLGSCFVGDHDFHHLIQLAGEGNRDQVDLLVKDIYAPMEPPIDGSLTASNFAKMSAEGNQTAADRMASLINMLAETIVLLSLQSAALHKTNKIYFIGSTLAGNKPFIDKLTYYTVMLHLEPGFIDKGEYCGSVGALLSI